MERRTPLERAIHKLYTFLSQIFYQLFFIGILKPEEKGKRWETPEALLSRKWDSGEEESARPFLA